jgi:hypothetical protein
VDVTFYVGFGFALKPRIRWGTYRVTDTIFVPSGTIIVGEMLSTIMGTGPNFADQNNPQPVIRAS